MPLFSILPTKQYDYQQNSLLFKVKMVDDNKFNINNFIDLFLEDGPFESYLNEVYGIATHNYQLKICNITFKQTTPKKILEDLRNTFYELEIIAKRKC